MDMDTRLWVNLSKTALWSLAIGAMASMPLYIRDILLEHDDLYTTGVIPGFAMIVFAATKGNKTFAETIKHDAQRFDRLIQKICFWQSKKNKSIRGR